MINFATISLSLEHQPKHILLWSPNYMHYLSNCQHFFYSTCICISGLDNDLIIDHLFFLVWPSVIIRFKMHLHVCTVMLSQNQNRKRANSAQIRLKCNLSQKQGISSLLCQKVSYAVTARCVCSKGGGCYGWKNHNTDITRWSLTRKCCKCMSDEHPIDL